MNKLSFIRLAEVASTNLYARENIPPEEDPVIVYADRQTAGKGQRGNSWESAPGCNLTLSYCFHPEGIAPNRQFFISEAVALAVVVLLAENGIEAKVKWPNDIYCGDRKICGILIEHSLFGKEIQRTVAGVGINVNQKKFVSDAPNPVSMTQLTGKEYDLQALLIRYGELLEEYTAEVSCPEGQQRIHTLYKSKLWRGDNAFHPFTETASGDHFEAKIEDVEPSGILHLRDTAGRLRNYAFKEVSFEVI